VGIVYFNVSIHDISPARENESRALLQLCEECGVRRGTLLVVPDFQGQHLLNYRLPLVSWLQKLAGDGWEIALHGCEHQMPEAARLNFQQRLIAYHYTAHEGEFYLLKGPDARARIARGLQIMRMCGLEPGGFVAPAWLMSQETLQVLKQFPFAFATSLGHLFDLQRRLRYFLPVKAYSSRSPGRVLVSAAYCHLSRPFWQKLPLIRLALHPSDLHSPLIARTAKSLLRQLARQRTCIPLEEYTNLMSSRKVL
jgi:hypothetical protein